MLERVKSVRKSLGLNQTEFAKHLGLTQTAYSMIENGNRPLSDKHIKVISSELGISETWLRTGTGEMFSSSPYEKEFLKIYESLSPVTQKYLIDVAKELLETEKGLLNHMEGSANG